MCCLELAKPVLAQERAARLHGPPTLGGAEKPKERATASKSRRCTLKMDLSWWLLYASRKLRYASRAACGKNNQLENHDNAAAASVLQRVAKDYDMVWSWWLLYTSRKLRCASRATCEKQNLVVN